MTKSKGTSKIKGKGLMLLNFSVAIYLFATGILGITEKIGEYTEANEIGFAVNSIFQGRGQAPYVLTIILSVVAIAAGVFIFIKLFGVSISNIETLLIILAVTWLVFILMIDIIWPISDDSIKFPSLSWLRSFGSHAMVLAAIIMGTDKFGIK